MTALYEDIDSMLNSISPDLMKIEKLRKSREAVYHQRLTMAASATIILLILFVFMLFMDIPIFITSLYLLVSLYLFIELAFWVLAPKLDYIKHYKFKILPLIANTLGKFKYHGHHTLSMTEMERSGLIPRHHIYHAEDFFEGRYKGVDICFWEARFLEDISLDSDKPAYIPVFNGLIIYIHIPHCKFSGHTVVLKNTLADRRKLNRHIRKMKRAHMVDPEFEKLFTVYTTDQIEGRYLVNPVVIESIKAIHKKFSAVNLSAAFYEEQITLMIPSNINYFEPGAIDMHSQNIAVISEIRDQMKRVLSIIDELKLPQKAQPRPHAG